MGEDARLVPHERDGKGVNVMCCPEWIAQRRTAVRVYQALVSCGMAPALGSGQCIPTSARRYREQS